MESLSQGLGVIALQTLFGILWPVVKLRCLRQKARDFSFEISDFIFSCRYVSICLCNSAEGMRQVLAEERHIHMDLPSFCFDCGLRYLDGLEDHRKVTRVGGPLPLLVVYLSIQASED
ncbi:hypothetical protein NDU88_002021 [Pleurodeles waltl]|uniref:Uncharacterized protein n=1 Tax=Pleurodeles waltl TaxID=8319 RepID=A0AAV7T0S7_PLEWA|nr:hypothetical protein NDU88_002021 [Pleurodeles waltl]